MSWSEEPYERHFSPSPLACRGPERLPVVRPPHLSRQPRIRTLMVEDYNSLPLSQSFSGYFESLSQASPGRGFASPPGVYLTPTKSPESPWQRFPSMLRKSASRQLSSEFSDDGSSSPGRESRSTGKYGLVPVLGVPRSISWDVSTLNANFQDPASVNLMALTRFKVNQA